MLPIDAARTQIELTSCLAGKVKTQLPMGSCPPNLKVDTARRRDPTHQRGTRTSTNNDLPRPDVRGGRLGCLSLRRRSCLPARERGPFLWNGARQRPRFPRGDDRRDRLGHVLTSSLHEQSAIADQRGVGPHQAQMQLHRAARLNRADLDLGQILTFGRANRGGKQGQQLLDDGLRRRAVGGAANVDRAGRDKRPNHHRCECRNHLRT